MNGAFMSIGVGLIVLMVALIFSFVTADRDGRRYVEARRRRRQAELAPVVTDLVEELRESVDELRADRERDRRLCDELASRALRKGARAFVAERWAEIVGDDLEVQPTPDELIDVITSALLVSLADDAPDLEAGPVAEHVAVRRELVDRASRLLFGLSLSSRTDGLPVQETAAELSRELDEVLEGELEPREGSS